MPTNFTEKLIDEKENNKYNKRVKDTLKVSTVNINVEHISNFHFTFR